MSYLTTPTWYYQSIISEMKRSGYRFLGWVTLNSHRNKYYTDDVDFGQRSRIFLSVPNKPIIVCLEKTEHFGRWDVDPEDDTKEVVNENYYETFWKAIVIVNYNYVQMMTELLNGPSEGEEFSFEKCFRDSLFEVEEIDPNANKPNLVVRLKSREVYNSRREERMHEKEWALPFRQLLEELGPYMKGKFPQLSVCEFHPCEGFPNNEDFPNQEEDFWDVFPTWRLKYLCEGRILGLITQLRPALKAAV